MHFVGHQRTTSRPAWRQRRLIVLFACASLMLALSSLFPQVACAQRQIKTVDPPPTPNWLGLPGRPTPRQAAPGKGDDLPQQTSWPQPAGAPIASSVYASPRPLPGMSLQPNQSPLFSNLGSGNDANGKPKPRATRRRPVGF
ncbi:MAG: hypothetical protein JSS27_17735 [Planctomycetes bacterium]|nr:hypothetical protein [Planctomycetota bacterium]